MKKPLLILLLLITQYSLASEPSEFQIKVEPTLQELMDEFVEDFDREMLFPRKLDALDAIACSWPEASNHMKNP